MQRIAFGSVLALTLSVASVEAARADDASDMQKMVQSEIKAYLEKQKEADAKDNVMKAKWSNGPLLETSDKRYSLRITTRIHIDTNLIDADRSLEGPAPGIGDDFDDATFVRRLRLGLAGDITSHVDYSFMLDFATPQNPNLRDAYITIKDLKRCLGCWAPAIRVGQQYEAIGLESVSAAPT